jgi:hypothetical protein
MFGDPDFFEIDQLKGMNMWPASTMTSRGVIPYVKRMRTDKVKVTVVGDFRGDTVRDILDSCPNVFRVYVVNQYADDEKSQAYKSLFESNTKMYKDKIRYKSDRESDLVCIDQSACTSDNLALYYKLVKSGGIFSGNGHEYVPVKDELNKFRREVKIGTPIQVSNRAVWFWYKR